MNPQIMDALVQTINEAINSKVKALKDDLVSSIANEQRRHLIQLSKTAVKSEVVDLGKELRGVIDDYIKNLPKPENGKDGEDAPAPTAEQIAEAVTAWMVANFIQPTNGKDGNDGKDSTELEVLPSIDDDKSYPKGTWASYKGGLIKSTRTTSGLIGKSLLEAGWDVIVQGVHSVEVHPLAEGEFAVKTMLTGGKDHITKFAVPVMVYKGIWKEGAYTKGNTVTTGGSLWHCNKDTTDKPGTSEAWQLCAKKGTDGRDGKDLNVVKMNKPEFYKLDK
jgi:hypothetical protein